MASRNPVRFGTRTSRLALVQTDMVRDMLRARAPDVSFEVVGITTRGDRRLNVPIPELGQGAFVKELEASLLTGEIDVAVHSLKDLPSLLPPGLCLAAVPPRGDPRDALVSRAGLDLRNLPPDARVGTGSPRRGALLRAHRPDLEVVAIRGNVDTRVRKVLEEEGLDAAVLAAAGLQRLGRADVISQLMDTSFFLPAAGQGFLVLECRADDTETLTLVALCQDPDSRQAADAERAFLAAIGGGCKAPLAAYAYVDEQGLSLEGLIATLDGARVLRHRVHGPDLSHDEAGTLVREGLVAQGAEEIMAEAERA